MRTYFENNIRLKTQRLADLKTKTAQLERELSDAGVSIDHELAQFSRSPEQTPRQSEETPRWAWEHEHREHGADIMSDLYAAQASYDYPSANSGNQLPSSGGRTDVLVNHGRRSAYYPRLSRRLKLAIGTATVTALVTILVMILSGGGEAWPPGVATVQSQAAIACQNPDVKSEPGQVNFACAEATRQILWVFALMTSANNPRFADAKTGRIGLEPIAPAQGGELAWSLNLHHPYNPSNPVDSLEVAARALNNIIGGASVTGTDGRSVVQPGLEGNSANCVRYTGSAAVTSRNGFPSLCAKPVTSLAGQAALVADIYSRWIVGAPPWAAQDAAVLFANAQNPGDPQVQAILTQLRNSGPLA